MESDIAWNLDCWKQSNILVSQRTSTIFNQEISHYSPSVGAGFVPEKAMEVKSVIIRLHEKRGEKWIYSNGGGLASLINLATINLTISFKTKKTKKKKTNFLTVCEIGGVLITLG